MSIISENLNNIKLSLPTDVTLIAVSKTKPVSDLMEAYNAGQRIFGENKIQEMTEKWQEMPKDIEWHMIGHVQTNKIKFMIPYVKLIHGVDSLKLLKEINRLGIKWRKKVNCLLQVSIAQEETKFGLDESELNEILDYIKNDDSATNINVVGLMGMATFTDNQEQIRNEFNYLKCVFDKTQEKNPNFQILSMGMSGDYQIAIECGSTMIRIGSSIFGTR
ncbi:YggS family pyridoxal phosphate-dependent enzyme [Flavobacterium amniphilum]|uniref:YggS family pyridoxal phosphate-dependent enzyme n=1 Tax=Flavobacterium amniphilum TaxID=1834035 RepID=UPI00202A3D1A|nr:YggS family pyridoxal phosphate-dependent enzyme [Flavobacterium amniphilum]MCL9807565.1 YggS family pyridoxal phosphate-dependent enzyme [Flavobacterium amniphilum]